MLNHVHFLVTMNYLMMSSKFNQLIISLMTTYADELYLVKEQTSYNELFDAVKIKFEVL
jgi:hypothetical protein